jgi:hypothetical protein
MKEKNKSRFPDMICGEDHPTHQCPQKDEVHQFLAKQKAPQQPSFLIHPFPLKLNTWLQQILPLHKWEW